MQYFSILEQSSKEAIWALAEKRGLTENLPENYRHPQEDYILVSENPPVFVVADGVTLNFHKLIEKGEKYPDPSPAGEVARIFCEAVVENVKEKHETFNAGDTKEIFEQANTVVAGYNKKAGKSEISGNMTGFFAATGAFVVVKEDKAYWASICDSFVAHFDKNMNLKFMSSGSCSPYAVINGEERMIEYIENEIFNLEDKDRVLIFTDGFEHYVRNPDFLNIFNEEGSDLKEKIKEFSNKMNLKDPEKYGHERSLIVVGF
jgi:hypothetical protein